MTTPHTQHDDRSLWIAAAKGGGRPEDPCPSLMTWSQWADGGIDPMEQSQLEGHLAQCDLCYQVVVPFRLEQARAEHTQPLARITRWAAAVAAAVVVSVLAWHAATLAASPATISSDTMIAEASFGSLAPDDRSGSYSVIFATETGEVAR